MGAGAVIGAGIGAITSGVLAIDGNNRKKRAEAELRNLVPPELRNYYSDVPLSTYGSRIASQNMAQNNANMINAGQRGGIRALSSIAPVLTEANIQQNQAIAQDIDRQYRENKQMEAQGADKIMAMQEQRYSNTLAGLQQERASGLQDTYTGLSNLAGSVASIGTAFAGKGLGQLGQNKQGTTMVNTALNHNNTGAGLNPFFRFRDIGTQPIPDFYSDRLGNLNKPSDELALGFNPPRLNFPKGETKGYQ